MTKRSVLIFYVVMTLLFGAGIALILKTGENAKLAPYFSAPVVSSILNAAVPSAPADSLHPAALFVLQLLLVVLAAKAVGFIFRKFHQPAVMGEIVAGILLGPSLLGWIFPHFSHFIFPEDGLKVLKIFSQIGILLFMFLTGMELDTEILKKKAHQTLAVSHAGILLPFFLGALISLALYPDYGMAGTSFRAFALFMGVAMSITAFPVLVRILEEKKMIKTPMGTLAIGCAAVDDVTAWCLLAGVIAIVTAQSPHVFFATLGWTAFYGAAMYFIFRPGIRKITEKSGSWPAFLLLAALAGISAWTTEKIGIHALFGAFLAGVIAPNREELQEFIRRQLAGVNAVLLPLFFALTGLRTQIGLMQGSGVWTACALILLAAILGKLGGSAGAARFMGMKWKDALCLGALMNTRGLMELIVLNIGYDLGILSPVVFTMMVIMALVTTFMTGPLLALWAPDPQR